MRSRKSLPQRHPPPPPHCDMGMQLDLPTILLLYKTALVAGALSIFHVSRHSCRPRGLKPLAAAYLLLAVGAELAGQGEYSMLPLWFWTHTSLLLGALGYTLFWAGARALSGRRRVLPAVLILVPGGWLVLGLVTQFPLDNLLRAGAFRTTAAPNPCHRVPCWPGCSWPARAPLPCSCCTSPRTPPAHRVLRWHSPCRCSATLALRSWSRPSPTSAPKCAWKKWRRPTRSRAWATAAGPCPCCPRGCPWAAPSRSSTWTTSSTSMTASAMRRATACWSPRPTHFATSCAIRTCWPAWAVKSSWSTCRTPAPVLQAPSPSACAGPCSRSGCPSWARTSPSP